MCGSDCPRVYQVGRSRMLGRYAGSPASLKNPGNGRRTLNSEDASAHERDRTVRRGLLLRSRDRTTGLKGALCTQRPMFLRGSGSRRRKVVKAQRLKPAVVRLRSNVGTTWEQLRPNTGENGGEGRPESKTSQQDRQPGPVCKTSIPGSNPGGASKFPSAICDLWLTPSIPQPRNFPFFWRCSFRGLASGEAREAAELFGRGPADLHRRRCGSAGRPTLVLCPVKFHRHSFRDATPDHVAGRGPPEVVGDAARTSGCEARGLPCLRERADRLSDVSSHRARGPRCRCPTRSWRRGESRPGANWPR